MGVDEERRGEQAGSKRRDSTRTPRPKPPVIEAAAETSTEPVVPFEPQESIGVPDQGAPEAHVSPGPVAESAAVQEPVIAETVPETPGPERGFGDRVRRHPRSGAEERQRPSIVPALAALVVAILAAGWIYLYNQMSAMEAGAQADLANLQAKVAALEARPAPDTGALTKRIDTIATQAQEHFETLTRRVDGLPTTGSDPKQIETVAAQVGETRKALGDLQAAVAAVPKPDLSGVDKRIDALDERLGGVDGRVSQVQAAVSAIPHVDLGPLTGKVDGLEARVKPLESEAEAARSPQNVAERRAAPVAVTAQAIVEAIAAGQAFPHELAALQALGADPAKIAPLQSVAGSGAPSLRDLQADLAARRETIVAQGAPKPSGSYMDRIMAGAGALVQVRPLGSVAGDTPASIVARINDAIGADELSRALREWDSLPEASRNASKGLADRIRMRLDAEEAAKAIAANAIGAMGAPRG